MKPDDFEQKVGRIPRAPIPGDWKQDILRVAREEAAGRTAWFGVRWLGTALEGAGCRRRPCQPRVESGGKPPQSMTESQAIVHGSWLDVLSAPWVLLAAGWMVIALLQWGLAGFEKREASGRSGMAGVGSRPSVLAAVRLHRAELLTLSSNDESAPAFGAPAQAPTLTNPSERPRSEALPDRNGMNAALAARRMWS